MARSGIPLPATFVEVIIYSRSLGTRFVGHEQSVSKLRSQLNMRQPEQQTKTDADGGVHPVRALCSAPLVPKHANAVPINVTSAGWPSRVPVRTETVQA